MITLSRILVLIGFGLFFGVLLVAGFTGESVGALFNELAQALIVAGAGVVAFFFSNN